MALRLFSIIFITTALVGVRVAGTGSMRPGGTTEERQPTPEVQAIIDSIKPQVEVQLGRAVDQWTLLGYMSQVVAGINYFAKVDIGEEDVVHVRVYKDLSGNTQLSDMLYPKDRSHPILYF